MRAGFSEVTGLEDDVPAIDHRDGGGTGLAARRMPGLSRFNNITLKRGMTRDSDFSKWLLAAAGSPPRDLSISLRDEEGKRVLAWRLARARPIKVVGPRLEAKANEVAMEEVELAHEGLRLERGDDAG